MGTKSSGQPAESAPQGHHFAPELVQSMYGQETVVIKIVRIPDDEIQPGQQNQQDGDVLLQAGDDQHMTAQPS